MLKKCFDYVLPHFFHATCPPFVGRENWSFSTVGRNIAWVASRHQKNNEVLLVMPCCRGIRNQVGGSDLMGLLIGVDVFLGWVVFKNPLNP